MAQKQRKDKEVSTLFFTVVFKRLQPLEQPSTPYANSNENTLSSFSNSIPPDYLAKHQSLKVAVRGLGINLKMVKGLTLTPASKHMPALIQITRENWADCVGTEDSLNYLTISMFESKYALKLYVDKDTHYTPESLYCHFAT